MEGTKICSKCEVEKELTCFSAHSQSKDGTSRWCKECFKKYYIENKEKIKDSNKSYRLKNIDRVRERIGKYNKSTRSNLSDVYITFCLTRDGLSYEEITPEMMDIKRRILKEKRNRYYINVVTFEEFELINTASKSLGLKYPSVLQAGITGKTINYSPIIRLQRDDPRNNDLILEHLIFLESLK